MRAGNQLARISPQAAVKAVKSRGCKTITPFSRQNYFFLDYFLGSSCFLRDTPSSAQAGWGGIARLI
jgi:hypothetical protein